LHHAGFALPPPLLSERWALTPPFHPYLYCVPLEDIPKVFLRAITGIRSTGGIFSVALSVTRPLRTASPGVTRRVALYFEALRLKSTLCCRKVVSGLSSRRPISALQRIQNKPAIIQLTRHSQYIASASSVVGIRSRDALLTLCQPIFRTLLL
jgi:hypothetical protein